MKGIYPNLPFPISRNNILAAEHLIISDGETENSMLLKQTYTVEGFAIAICRQGMKKIKINLKEYDITENTIVTVLPNSLIEIVDASNGTMEFLFFPIGFMSDIEFHSIDIDFAIKLVENPCIKATDEQISILLEYHSFISNRCKSPDWGHRIDIIKRLLIPFSIEIADIYNYKSNKSSNARIDHKDYIFSSFMKLLYKEHRKQRTIKFYADKLCLSPKYFALVIKHTSGKSAVALINEMIISTIKSLLRSSDKTILQISEELNFPNQSFFSRFFKKHTGLTPLEYRRL